MMERILWESEGIYQLDNLPDRTTRVEEALKNSSFRKLVGIAPRGSAHGKDDAFNVDKLKTVMAVSWMELYVKELEQKIKVGQLDAAVLARELMIDRLRLACLPDSDPGGAISSVRAELRKRYEEKFSQDPIRWISEYVRTMGSRHDRYSCIAEVLNNPPGIVAAHDITSLRASAVTALFDNGGGGDWATVEGQRLLGLVLEKDNHLGVCWLLDYLATRGPKMPAALGAGIEKKAVGGYKTLHSGARDAVLRFVRKRPYPEVAAVVKTIALEDARPEAKAEAIDLALQGSKGHVEWLRDVLPAEAASGFAKMLGEVSDKEDIHATIRDLLSMGNPLVAELVARISVSEGLVDNRIAELLVNSPNDLAPDTAKLIRGKIAWSNEAGVDMLKASLAGDKKVIRSALLTTLENASDADKKGYARVIVSALSPDLTSRYEENEIVAMINIATGDAGKGHAVAEVVEGFLNEDSFIYKNRNSHDGNSIFLQSLYACGDIPGSAVRIKDVILEGLRNSRDSGHHVAAAHALRSWPVDKPLDPEVIQTVSAFLSQDGDAIANSHRLDKMISNDPERNVSSKLEILDFLNQRKKELAQFRDPLGKMAGAARNSMVRRTDRDPRALARELLK